MNDEQMEPLMATWFSDREVAAQDVRGGVARVMADVPQTRQAGRWLPFPLFRRTTSTPTVASTTEYRPTAMPATNGHSASSGHPATVIGRTQSMFSPAKAITAGALVVGIGSVLLLAQPLDQRGTSVPGAATDDPAMAPSFFSGTFGDDWIRNSEPVAERREDGVVDVPGRA